MIDISARNVPQEPAISVSTRLVQVGVIVHDKNGPVANLTKDDFVVLDRGKPQKVAFFSVESSESAPQATQPLPQNTFSDLPRYGGNKPRSLTILLLDNLNTLTGSAPLANESTPFWLEDHALANAKQHLLEFLKQLDPNDRLAIYGLTDTLHVLCDFTCDRAQLLAVVNRYDPASKTQRAMAEPGQYSFPDQPSPLFNNAASAGEQQLASLNNQARGEATMAALTAIASHVVNIPGRKNLLWLTANLPFSGAAIARILARANIAAYPVDARGLLPLTPATTRDDLGVGEQQAHDALGLTARVEQSGQPTGIDAMQKMAEDTGGRAFINTNDLTGAIRKAVEDSAVTYTLAFYIGSDSLDGNFHELKIQVKRDGLTIRYPRGYFAADDTLPTKDQNWRTVITALQSPIESSLIPLQAKVDRVDQPLPNSLKVLCSIDIHNLRFAQTGDLRKGAVSVFVIQQDVVGKVLGQWTRTYDLRLSEKQYVALLKSGMPFRQDVRPRAGVTTLRILVEDPATSDIGSLIIPLSQIK
ncbi:MAG: VWA domain-containing protein [Candidatus Acidiferrum sp.]